MGSYRVPMSRRDPKERDRGPLIAYDLETTRIPESPNEPLSVEPRYLTAYGRRYRVSRAVRSYRHLGRLLRDEFLLPETNGARFVAWNGNRFDVRLIMHAIIESGDDRFTIHPFVAKQAGLRGVRVTHGDYEWSFLDGLAMLGLKCDLDTFLKAFAPDRQKLTGAIDWSTTEFNARNRRHREYAERDAEGLWHGMIRADGELRDLTGRGVQATIGNAGIKAFIANMPGDVEVHALDGDADRDFRRVLMRGGYVFVARQCDEPLWTYDLNQAYAAAMRDSDLPCGKMMRTRKECPELIGAYVVEVSRSTRAAAPIYVRDFVTGRSVEAWCDPIVTMLCSNEIETFRRYGWKVDVIRGYVWSDRFRMTAFVDRLEAQRKSSPAGSPRNIIVKAIGCNAYGKTSERLQPLRYLFAKRAPDGALPFLPGDVSDRYLWVVPEEKDQRKYYHRPQLSAFITAHVRCVLYDAIMLAPNAFVKADTDSVAFTHPVDLPMSKWEYGRWKLESDGIRHIVLGKKVYAKADPDDPMIVCKGLRVDQLTIGDFERWLSEGTPPAQVQMHLVNWRQATPPTYRAQSRRGTQF